MRLSRQHAKANDVRAPAVKRGEAVVVGRYSERNPKVVLVHPDDLAMLEESHEALQSIGRLEFPELSSTAQRLLAEEDRPSGQPLEDPEALQALLGL